MMIRTEQPVLSVLQGNQPGYNSHQLQLAAFLLHSVPQEELAVGPDTIEAEFSDKSLQALF